MVLQRSSVGNPYIGIFKIITIIIITIIAMILFSAKVGIFPLSYAVISSFIFCFTAFYCLDSY